MTKEKKILFIKRVLGNSLLSDYDKVFNMKIVLETGPNPLNYIRDSIGCKLIIDTINTVTDDDRKILITGQFVIASYMNADNIMDRTVSLMRRDTTRSLNTTQQLTYLLNMFYNINQVNIPFTNIYIYRQRLDQCLVEDHSTEKTMEMLYNIATDLIIHMGGLHEIRLDPHRFNVSSDLLDECSVVIPKFGLMERTKRLNSIKHETYIRHTVNSISENLIEMSDKLTIEELEMSQSILNKLKERWYKMHELKSTIQEQKNINELEEPVDVCVRDLEAKIEFEELTGINQLQATIDSLALAIERK